MQNLYPNSSGLEKPKLIAPENSCDSHIHIMDAAFKSEKPVIKSATAQDYMWIQKRIGTQRAIVVQPKDYGTDNRCTVNAIAKLGLQNTRGIAVVSPEITDVELEQLHEGGIRGVRFSLWKTSNAVVTFDMIKPIASRIVELGWHIQLHITNQQLIDAYDFFRGVPCDMVFDHLGRINGENSTESEAFKHICDLMGRGKSWVKLSGAYLNTREGAPFYSDVTPVAKRFASEFPERVIWGSDWPHVTETDKPDDSVLFDLLSNWVSNEKIIHMVLVDNPEKLYGF
jgi:predicted TIM-barrel fold metal-dependent hydrolase